MRVTVAICTWNRCALLRQTLEQVTKLLVPAGVDWELLVVNNNCTDATDEVVRWFSGKLPIRRLFEPKPGHSHARNLAAREANGDYILWTDDDVLLDSGWMAEYCRAFDRWPDATIFGGPIEPWFDGTPPRWLQEIWPRVAFAYATRNLGDEPIPLTQRVVPFGANFAVRAKDQARYLYDPNLGRKQHDMLGYDEITLIRTMLDQGAKGWWVPRARLHHFIPKDRQTIRYIRRYFVGSGKYLAKTSPDSGVRKLFGRPRWLWRRAIQAELRYHLRRLFGTPELWIDDLKTASICWGQLRGYGSRSSD